MAKRDKRRHEVQQHPPYVHPPQMPVEPQPQPQPTPYRRSHQSLPLSLDDIRASALRERANVAHTIADLEAWSMEIAATIAFLKARGQQ